MAVVRKLCLIAAVSALAALNLVPFTTGAEAIARDSPVGAAHLWQAMTAADVEAAHRMLREDHPGSTEEVDDAAFRERLQVAHALARARAGRTTSFAGYLATMQGFATAMGDKHIWSRPLAVPVTADWPGFLVARRGADWIVAHEDNPGEGPSLIGARLVSCDGMGADALAERRLGGFRAFWPIHAQRIATAPWLMIDDGNPFLTRPSRCAFEQEGRWREVALRWRTARRSDLTARFSGLVRRGAPGFGVRRFGDGYWISLQSLSDEAIPVVEQVRAETENIRRARFVVLDLRGNGGGSSSFGDQIADVLMGARVIQATPTQQEGEGCSVVWRTSERNLEMMHQYEELFGRTRGPEAAAIFRRLRETGMTARAEGRAFTWDPLESTCRHASLSIL